MCIKIINSNAEAKYDSERPLEDQLHGSKEIVIRYEPRDSDMDKFLTEIERFCKMGISTGVTVKVLHSNNIKGAMAKRQVSRMMRDLDLNEAIKILVSLHSKYDRTLKEMSEICKGK